MGKAKLARTVVRSADVIVRKSRFVKRVGHVPKRRTKSDGSRDVSCSDIKAPLGCLRVFKISDVSISLRGMFE